MSGSFTGGKLTLKGSKPGRISKKKKIKVNNDELALADESERGDADPTTGEGYALPQADQKADTRTPAERKFDERTAQLESERIAKMAAKSHREKVKEFNERIAAETEHFDIPRVGPG